jgi:hypothetical protein
VKSKRIELLAPMLLLMASVCLADNKPSPCALQSEVLSAATPGSREAIDALKHFQECLRLASEQERMDWAVTRHTWAGSLDKLPNGGWVFLTVSEDGTYAVFGSRRHAVREGSVASIWVRYEYRERQSHGGENYQSDVVRVMYDCARVASKDVAITYYSGSNLEGEPTSYTYDESKVRWSPAIPGTLGDSLLDWACNAAPRSAKPQ